MKETATLKIYPAVITSKHDKFWIETQGSKKISVKFNRDKMTNERYMDIFNYMLSLGYDMISRDTFMKQVPVEDLMNEERVLSSMFNLEVL